ncbi:glycerophosphodiester phosphodiesterase [Cohaesibacter celericrescens]|uniref:glycerophosphodiester phosphodiesterase n=1 Tax=Cohaesibacter celericrescens TaxID=2067669 RepID=UPI0035677556
MSFATKTSTLGWPDSRFGGPYIIGHRGASHHAIENSLSAFKLASELGADLWELDVRNTADGICVVSHDDDLSRVFGVDAKISELTLSALQALETALVPTLKQVIALAKQYNSGLYIEIKGDGAGLTAWQDLTEAGYSFAALGSFVPAQVSQLAAMGCPYPLTTLVRVGDDPFAQAKMAAADAVHLCWERASDRPDNLLTVTLMDKAREENLPIFLWHEERADVIKAIMAMDVAGVCSNRPELLVPYATSPARPSDFAKGPEVVCHRGINKLAPENTLPAAQLVFEQGFDWLELDVHETADGAMVVIHDDTLERTTNGTGAVAEKSLAELQKYDAGSWFSPQFTGTTIPTLAEMIDLANAWNKRIYIELKQVDPAKLLAQVEEKGFLDQCFFWSFDWSLIEQLRTHSDKANIMVRSLDYLVLSQAVDAINATIVEINMSEPDVNDKVAQVRKLGAQIMLCYMGGDQDMLNRMFALAPDMVNLDNPHLWKEVCHRAKFAYAGKTTAE